MLKRGAEPDHVIAGALKEARRITDFEVHQMKDGDFLVFFANPLLVYVGKDEYRERADEIRKRVSDLKFSSEEMVEFSGSSDETKRLIGLYARGKLQRDAWQQSLSYRMVKP
ncbi:MAG: hypothetical protein U1D69_01110 [Polynucleobacter sp.]|nr:hypothetical protein [Polynucleobacter sp.]